MNSTTAGSGSTSASPLDIVIVGGGTAGWMVAAAFGKILRGKYKITLVESDEIGTIGVGEATIPLIRTFHDLLGLDENEFLRETLGTFKLGIEFVDWSRPGSRYMHGFGRIGQELWTMAFDQYWRRMHRTGKAGDLADYSLARVAARANRFMRPTREVRNSPLNDIAYAFHFDASRYARYLRRYAEARGVVRREGKVIDVGLDSESGHVRHVQLADGAIVEGDFFIDCTGFQALLIGKALGVRYRAWNQWLPCDAAIALPSRADGPLLPYTRATARPHGWQWRIPLQHRLGNGYVFSTQHVGVDEATSVLLANVEGQPLADPRVLRFTAGMREKAWHKNCIAIGLSGGFLEPLESTSIHLIQSLISRLAVFFPDRGFNQREVDEFNRHVRIEYERIRDFLILHYHATTRADTAFWDHCRTMEIPETLRDRIELFRKHGRIFRDGTELFSEVAWLQVFDGQGIEAESHNPLADLPDEETVIEYLRSVREVIARCVAIMPDHGDYIAQHCAVAAETSRERFNRA
jgi:tryptophan halogenase